MKTKFRHIISRSIAILTGTAILASCSDDFLAQDPLSFYEPTSTFSTESGLQAALAMCDRHLRNYWTYYSSSANNVPISTEYMFSDISVFGWTDVGGNLQDDLAKKITPTSFLLNATNSVNHIGFFWDETYTGIKYANTILSYIDKVEGLSEEKKDEYKGRAYFHRAYRYYNLVFQFGNVPLITKIIETPKQNYRSTKKEAILEMLVSDMEKAINWVPDQKDMAYQGMVNKGACRVLLTKLYLATGQWEKAEQQADILIEQSGYSLMKENFGTELKSGENKTWEITRNIIWDLHRPENKMIAANKEIIMGMSNKSEEGHIDFKTMRIFGPFWNGNVNSPSGKKGVYNYSRKNADYNQELDWVRVAGRGIGISRLTHFAQHGLWTVNNVEDTKDLRHNSEVGNWMKMEDLKYNNPDDPEWYGKNLRLYADDGRLLCSDTIRCWFDFPLYKIYLKDMLEEENMDATTFAGATLGSDATWYLYRLAEVYLLRAEAKFYQGKDAKNDVNELRERALCSQLYSSTITIGDIVNERARELYLEEWRNVELKRISYCLAQSGKPDEWGNTYSLTNWDKQEGTDANGGSYWYQRIYHYTPYNKGAINSGVTLNYTMDKKNMYWPIPNASITSNNKGNIYQNYGYDGYDPNIPMWETWEEAVADEDKSE